MKLTRIKLHPQSDELHVARNRRHFADAMGLQWLTLTEAPRLAVQLRSPRDQMNERSK